MPLRQNTRTDFADTKRTQKKVRREPIIVASGKVQERRMRTKSETFLRDPEGSTPSR